jgi:hypothetical protein
VGRDREVAELVAGLDDAIGGRGRLFLIAGEPGIGKTWVVEHLAGRATDRGTRVLWGRCWEGGGAPPFWPWGQVIGALADDCDEQTLASWLGAAGTAHVAQLVPGLAGRLGTASPPEASTQVSDAARFYLFEAVAGLFRRAASAQPLLLVFEDLHAADEPSLLLLQFLARDLRGARLLVVGTYRDLVVERPLGIGEAVGELVREGQLLNLRGLDREAVKALIETLSGVVPSPARVAAVYDTTEGNPLFVREVVRLLTAQGALERPGQVPIPGTIRAVIGRRLAPLSSDAVQVLSAAAVVGRAFDLDLVVRTLRAAQAGEGVPADPAAGQAARPEAAKNLFRPEGEYWTVEFEGAVVRMKDAKGLRHLARLLAHPGQEFHVVDLEAADGQPGPAAPGRRRGRAGDGELAVRRDLGDAGVLLDARAKAAYQARLTELRAELAEAEGFSDLARATRARQEMDFLVGELARAVGLGGRDRRAASHAERARLNATRAIRAAMANLAVANPALGRHLSSTIRTGRHCSYTPDPRLPIRWER